MITVIKVIIYPPSPPPAIIEIGQKNDHGKVDNSGCQYLGRGVRPLRHMALGAAGG